jgi:hypothetical protein
MKVDFFIAGAPRCGTTSLYHYLAQHPEIEMSTQKEPAFFHFLYPAPDFRLLGTAFESKHIRESENNYRYARALAVTNEAAYEKLWTEGTGVLRRGEATPTYLFDIHALEQIEKAIPSARLVVLLRDPVTRAYSEYMQLLRKGVERFDSFGAALDREPETIDEFWWGARSYVRSGLYARALERCFSLFGRKAVEVVLTDDLTTNPSETLAKITTFLEIATFPAIDTSIRHKRGFVPKPDPLVRIARSRGFLRSVAHRVLPADMRSQMWRRIMHRRTEDAPPLDPDSRDRLADRFRDSNRRLAELIERDLSHWS